MKGGINVLEKINAIRVALEKECYLPALALALTLPDICGQIEYPELIRKNGSRLVGQQYKKWFKEWVGHYYADHTGFKQNGKYPKNPYFTDEMCYQLRCAYLHSGNSDIDEFGEKEDKQFKYIYHFSLSVNGGESYGTWWEEPQLNVDKMFKHRTVCIDVVKLCEFLCCAAEKYYNTKEDKKVFYEHQISITDIQRKAFEIQKLNS